jgi:glutathione S-transferase
MAEKGLTYENLVVDLRSFQHHTDWFKKLNPSAIVPALVVAGEDKPLVESNLINEYLDDAFPNPPLMPRDPAARHEIRRWSKYIDDVCLPAVQKPNWSKTMQPIAEKWTDEELEEHLSKIPTQVRRDLWLRMARKPFTQAEVEAGLDVLEDMTTQIEAYLKKSGGPWMFGEQFTLADVNTAPYVMRFEEERPGRLPPLTREWWQHILARPSWKPAQIGNFVEDVKRCIAEAMAEPT